MPRFSWAACHTMVGDACTYLLSPSGKNIYTCTDNLKGRRFCWLSMRQVHSVQYICTLLSLCTVHQCHVVTVLIFTTIFKFTVTQLFWTLPSICRSEHLTLLISDLAFFNHWITFIFRVWTVYTCTTCVYRANYYNNFKCTSCKCPVYGMFWCTFCSPVSPTSFYSGKKWYMCVWKVSRNYSILTGLRAFSHLL